MGPGWSKADQQKQPARPEPPGAANQGQPGEVNQHGGAGRKHHGIEERLNQEARTGPRGVERAGHEVDPDRGVGVKAAADDGLQPVEPGGRRHADDQRDCGVASPDAAGGGVENAPGVGIETRREPH